jgi:hypothetical protein
MRFRPNVPRHPIALPPTTSSDPSVLAFSLAKAGSSLMFDILQALSREAGLRYFSAEDTLFADNVSANRRAVDIGPVFHRPVIASAGSGTSPLIQSPSSTRARWRSSCAIRAT